MENSGNADTSTWVFLFSYLYMKILSQFKQRKLCGCIGILTYFTSNIHFCFHKILFCYLISNHISRHQRLKAIIFISLCYILSILLHKSKKPMWKSHRNKKNRNQKSRSVKKIHFWRMYAKIS